MKKLTKILLIAALFVMSLTVITACDDTDQKAHTHTWSDWVADNGYTHTRSCECGKNETSNHSWNNGVVTTSPTCISTGIKTFTCVDCGQTKTETIEIENAHSWNKWKADGYETHSRTCSVCNERITATHNFENDTCTDCGYNNTPATIQSVENAEVDFSTATIKMLVNKSIRSVNLSTAINVSLGSSWKLYTADSNLIATKLANLKDGENTFLIVVTSSDGLYDNTYTLTIYKSFEISVEYYDVYSNLIKTETADTGYEYNIAYTPQITGYTFNHWKSHNTPVTNFTPYDNICLYADCTANEYVFRFDVNGGDELTNDTQLVTFDNSYVLPIPTRTGYTWLGWYMSETQITDINGMSLENSKIAADTEVTAHWKVDSYTVTAQSNNSIYGTVSGSGDYDYNSAVTLTATTNSGCIFVGWYEGERRITKALNYAFNVPSENVTYTAKWCKVTIAETTGGNVTQLNGKYIVDDNVTLSVIDTFIGYDWVGWYTGDTFITSDSNYTITMPSEDKTYTAKFNVKTEMQIFDFASDTKSCTITSLKDETQTQITIPDYVTHIGSYAFDNDKNLTEIKLPNSVTSIGECAFRGCSGLTDIKLPNNLSRIENSTFGLCSSLIGITIPNSVTSIGNNAFYASALTNITIPSSVTLVEYGAFWACTELVNVTLSEGVQILGNGVFSYCPKLTSITIPNSVTNIGERAFDRCNSLTIYCEAESKPSGWAENWNSSSCPVEWNHNAYDVATEDSIYTDFKNKSNIKDNV